MDTSLQTQQQHNDEGMECPPTVPTFDASVLLAKAPVSLSNLKDELEVSIIFINMLADVALYILMFQNLMSPFHSQRHPSAQM